MESNIRCLNRDVIKYIAMFTMLLNHVANAVLTPGTLLFELLVDIGYFTAIPMCYFLVEGFSYTRSVREYGKRLLFFAVISQIPFALAFGYTDQWLVPLNMMCTLFLCFVMLAYLDNKAMSLDRKNLIVWGMVFLSCFCDWAVTAPLATFWFWEAKGNQKQQKKVFLYAAGIHGIMQLVSRFGQVSLTKNIFLTFGAVVPILIAGVTILYLYNGQRMKRGKNFSKYFFYWFYPVHLLILGIIRMEIG